MFLDKLKSLRNYSRYNNNMFFRRGKNISFELL